MVKWSKNLTVRSGKLSNVGSVGSKSLPDGLELRSWGLKDDTRALNHLAICSGLFFGIMGGDGI